MKPVRRSPAHRTDGPAELVCSNSLRSDSPDTPIGLLHAELRRLGSVVLGEADRARVPAGEALAVDRERFSAGVEQALRSAPGLERVVGEVEVLPPGEVVVATGPLTSEALTRALSGWTGDKLYFYDSIAPIVLADSVDEGVAFRASRWGRGDGADYLNLPLDEAGYRAFVAALLAAEKVVPHAFEEPRYFEGCLPIEVMAERGVETLAHGPMKPVGLEDPRTGRRPYAVVQLRQEDLGGTAYNLVGFQTRLTWPEQRRIFRTLPGLASAEFLRMGQIHRNTFIDAPRLLGADLALRAEPRVWFAGQISGVEGYVESAASGYLVALAVAARRQGRAFVPPPAETALGAVYRHITGAAHLPGAEYQPSNVTFGLFPPLPGRVPKSARREAHAARARAALRTWVHEAEVEAAPGAAVAR
jgi:methylenetetrahydrofolate--tRNA-(uracil-5-)-methyltransferase